VGLRFLIVSSFINKTHGTAAGFLDFNLAKKWRPSPNDRLTREGPGMRSGEYITWNFKGKQLNSRNLLPADPTL
jgi:hypothetical protein